MSRSLLLNFLFLHRAHALPAPFEPAIGVKTYLLNVIQYCVDHDLGGSPSTATVQNNRLGKDNILGLPHF